MKAVFFDLDYTLFDNSQYLKGAFELAAKYLAKKTGKPWRAICQKQIKIWRDKTSFYPRLFDDLLSSLRINDKKLVKEMVKVFNQHETNLKPYPDVLKAIKRLKKAGIKLGIITDGNIARQKEKIRALGLKKYFKIVIYTKAIAAKPSAKPFLAAAKKMKLKMSDQVFYVADNPLIDFVGAKKLNWMTIRLLRGEFRRLPGNKDVDFIAVNYEDISKILKV